MNYILRFSFEDKPECSKCMVSMVKMGLDGETIKVCAARNLRPKCPDEGRRNDCPLIEDRT